MTKEICLLQFDELLQSETQIINGGGWLGAVCTGVLAVGAVALTCAGAPALVGVLVAKAGATAVVAKVVVGAGIVLEAGAGVAATVSAYNS